MLATIGIVDCISVASASARLVSILVHGEQPFYLRLDGAERNENVTIFFVSYCNCFNFDFSKNPDWNVYGSPDGRQNRHCNCLMASGECLVTLIAKWANMGV